MKINAKMVVTMELNPTNNEVSAICTVDNMICDLLDRFKNSTTKFDLMNTETGEVIQIEELERIRSIFSGILKTKNNQWEVVSAEKETE